MAHDYDVIVVGGGHAGAEAASAAARLGARVALVTHRADTIGEMSCNPAIGGLGKGHLVREIDALDGLMGRVTDQAGIQYRLLNRSKGPAVRGPRTQADRRLYKLAMQDAIAAQDGLSVIEAGVDDLVARNDRCDGVVLSDGTTLTAPAVVLTAGTFLRGVIHRGDERTPAGRAGEAPANALGERLDALGLPMGRLKTGTPPRLDGRTIDWDAMPMQAADEVPVPFSFLTERIEVPQVACGITHTNVRTHEVIAANLDRSAVYGGAVAGKGPRYCPSIEDKVVRFADRTAHQVFLEPEGLNDHTVYPNGISTSLPADVQDAYVRTIHRLEDVRIDAYGYAIEYDYVDPRALRRSYELRAIPGLYLAGQINGTTGYEEAAAQGLMAGLNAARAAKGREPIVIERHEGYIGVMTDDLVTRGVTEPYRMFTSRAEYRLSLRADNADERLTPIGIEIGCVRGARSDMFHVKQRAVEDARAWAAATVSTPQQALEKGIKVNPDGRKRSILDLLALPDVGMDRIVESWPEAAALPYAVRERLEADALYAGYLDRQEQEIAEAKASERLTIPPTLDYAALPGLSGELRAKLVEARPETLGQAGRIEGMTPSALSVLLLAIKRHEAARDASAA